MNCATCGASAIQGATKCYRCDRVFANVVAEPKPAAPAKVAPRAPARQVARAHRPMPKSVIVAGSLSFSLALVFVMDWALLDDPPGVLLVAALYATLGAGLLKTWRGARAGTIALASVSLLLALISLWGGALAGWIVLAGSTSAIVALLMPSARLHFKRDGVAA